MPTMMRYGSNCTSMKQEKKASFFSKRPIFYIGLIALFLLLGARAISSLFSVHLSKTKTYHNARESRRGDIRKAKEDKTTIFLEQERLQVVRQVWIDEPDLGVQREFYMESVKADLVASIGGKEQSVIEEFQAPQGFLQEEVYWILKTTGEKVFPKRDQNGEICDWVYSLDSMKSVEEADRDAIMPFQRVRYFDAARAEWNLIENKLMAYMVTFCVITIPGHTPTRYIDPKTIEIEGSAQTMQFYFSKNVHEKGIESTGVKLRANGVTKADI